MSSESSSSRSSNAPDAAHASKHWPAPKVQLEAAREFLKACAAAHTPTLLLPDKDADGLCSGLIVYHTLIHLGLPPELLSVHFPAKGSSIHTHTERTAISKTGAHYVIATDQGSRGGPALASGAQTLIMDHHQSSEFPDDAVVCSAATCEPIAPSSTLAYVVCQEILREEGKGGSPESRATSEQLRLLCVMGTMGDLGTSFKWPSPFPSMSKSFKGWNKTKLAETIALINAPRRSAEYDVATAWRVLLTLTSSENLLPLSSKDTDISRLLEARASVKAETNRCARNPPKFSGDGRVALIRISSAAQIHPLIATRWAASLKGARLEVVMCANSGYLPGMTNFACRIAKSGRGGGQGVDIISILKEYAGRVTGLREAMGDDFARGHKEASGGIVPTERFEELWEAMANSEREETGSSPKKRRKTEHTVQKNNLEGWLKRS